MRLKQFLGRPITGIFLLSVPVLALVALSPLGSASQARVDSVEVVLGSDIQSDQAVALDNEIDDLSDWNYTGKKKSKKKKSPKSKKSKKPKLPFKIDCKSADGKIKLKASFATKQQAIDAANAFLAALNDDGKEGTCKLKGPEKFKLTLPP